MPLINSLKLFSLELTESNLGPEVGASREMIIGKQDENPLCALTLYDALALYALPLAYLGWTRSENILYALAFVGR